MSCFAVAFLGVGVRVDLPVWLLLLNRYCRMLLDETPLFDPFLLQDLDWSSNSVSFSPKISPSSPGEGFLLRPLCTADFNRGESAFGESLKLYSQESQSSRLYEKSISFILTEWITRDVSQHCLAVSSFCHILCSRILQGFSWAHGDRWRHSRAVHQ